MGKIESYEDLEIWQLGMDLVIDIYEITNSLPDRERLDLVSQLSRSAVSVPSNIAEGWGRGRTGAQANFIRIARGSLFEIATQVELVRRLGYVDESRLIKVIESLDLLGKKLNAYSTIWKGTWFERLVLSTA